MNVVTIVPPDVAKPGTGTRTMGTKVLLADGSELQGVTKIVLVAEPNDVWRAEISVMPRMGVMPGMLAQINAGKVSWWRRLLVRLAGYSVQTDQLTVGAEGKSHE
jgi:hypothetical protein